MTYRIATLALALATATSAIKITSTDIFDDLYDAFSDAGDALEGATNEALGWTEGAATDIAEVATVGAEETGATLMNLGYGLEQAMYEMGAEAGAEIGTEVAGASAEELLLDAALLAAAA